MSLTDLMSAAQLATYPEIAMVIFMGVFVAISVRLLLNRDRDHAEWERARNLPLNDREEAR